MGLPQVDIIYTVDGKPDDFEAIVESGNVVVWIPESPDDMIDIRFISDTPFSASRLTATHKGQAVGAVVIATVPSKSKKGFKYTFSTKGPKLESAEPQIIVDGGGGSVPGPIGGSGKSKGRKKNGTKKR